VIALYLLIKQQTSVSWSRWGHGILWKYGCIYFLAILGLKSKLVNSVQWSHLILSIFISKNDNLEELLRNYIWHRSLYKCYHCIANRSKLLCFLLVDSPAANPSSSRRTALAQQTEVISERPPGIVPLKHTFVETSVLSTGVMTLSIRCVEKSAKSPKINYKH